MSDDYIFYNDVDPIETNDWIQSIESVIKEEGIERAKFLLKKTIIHLNKNKVIFNIYNDDYINSISRNEDEIYPGNLILEEKIRSVIRWNAIMIVLRASKKKLDLGGHIASYQSSSYIYEVCFNHFFKAYNNKNNGDIIYFQGHISPGIYARSFVEGRLSTHHLDNFRQEISGKGLSSYPHPKLMPNFWQFPTVSMGLGPISAIYQAKFIKYLENRELQKKTDRKIFAFLGDGEMDEPESKGVLNIAAREKLNNLIFVINCNLQRLDGPVYGNGKIINELENIFKGAGWEVIKVIWGNNWENLLLKDKTGKLVELINNTLDGDFQNFNSKDGSYIRKNFFGKFPETLELVKNFSDQEIEKLNYGGHDPKKIYTAFKKAYQIKDKPIVILFHTIKGFGLGKIAESKNIAHQIKKIDFNTIKYIRDNLNIPISDKNLYKLPYLSFNKNSLEFKYLHNQRIKLGGYVPSRRTNFTEKLVLPKLEDFNILFKNQDKISTTIVFVRILNILLRDKNISNRIVPIIADEARTFGMEGLFRQIGIYNSNGLKYTPQDKSLLTYYKEDIKGQILQEGINESGAFASWLAAATSYSTNNFPMIPFYIYYSIFGFQRIGDFCWAAGDQQARGFLIGATSGRTTLNGEGLQHEDGHSHIHSLTIPNCLSYDPTYAYELAIIIHNGLKRMYGSKQENIYYYITTMNEFYNMPKMNTKNINGICKGIYKIFSKKNIKNKIIIQLLGSGAILRNMFKAADILYYEYNINSDIFSVTSFTEIAREGQDCDHWNLLHPFEKRRIPYITNIMKNYPTVAATDYMKIFAEQIRKYIPTNNYFVLGTDGYGRSDSRQNLRDFFEINELYIVLAVLNILLDLNLIDLKKILYFIKKYKININKNNPRTV
ncbi:pyruvate dehydrogenase (acetyl-transferring), homodimeric type [Enterobacteriaceae endosymbiont of Donacia bicoloricornis]|uniref:pyruvate dehydrogenase (acetyl-transferring), homodimeric type n=1 Tax=Enterobacteriaceae endosymbiont of Donacia bicoloricornis TaxID=2675772 RepID=UPI00144A0C1B|nr:pyruvate dehydrogenase (acetyl-transferring), homodimeric type [Enterobacteriaceae endosymbiont of Donacia bicoloricornis]QJC37734.1 pyruvate dehydrogenase (acetyl-transferring), homodimeric type [Enterobacteriaceae endosymbiont of Donacia bicoloricornis]